MNIVLRFVNCFKTFSQRLITLLVFRKSNSSLKDVSVIPPPASMPVCVQDCYVSRCLCVCVGGGGLSLLVALSLTYTFNAPNIMRSVQGLGGTARICLYSGIETDSHPCQGILLLDASNCLAYYMLPCLILGADHVLFDPNESQTQISQYADFVMMERNPNVT